MKKKVYKVSLDGSVGYFRSVTRMKPSNIRKEAVKFYPTAKINIEFQPTMTCADANIENAKIIDNRNR